MSDAAQNVLHAPFLRAADRFPDNTALEVVGESLTYRTLRARAASLAATLSAHSIRRTPPLTAVYGQRTATAFAGVLGALLRGHGYVPLNPTFPVERTRTMLVRSGCRELIVDRSALALVDAVLEGVDDPLLVIVPDEDDLGGRANKWPQHTFVGSTGLEPQSSWVMPDTQAEDIAYLLFTSGSTGEPKGVMVTHANARHAIDFAIDRYDIHDRDRLSQTFDLTFDLSVFDMFVAWSTGACLCSPSGKILVAPGRFLRESQLTVWFSVPSTGVFMRRLGMLKPRSYPDLRWSLFCGEPLPADVARAWAEAAPNSTVENLYGPTEVTIACTVYRWDDAASPAESELGLVPIGLPFPGMEALIVDAALDEVPDGKDGELLMTGPQVTPGYWNDPERTQASFVVPPGRTTVHYRTGDRVRRSEAHGTIHYLGRLDNQIKIQGHRVELAEVEAVLRETAGRDAVVAIGWPRTASGAGGIAAFLEEPELAVEELRRSVRQRLPEYMVPRRFEFVDRLPLNANGKYDRSALVRMLETEA